MAHLWRGFRWFQMFCTLTLKASGPVSKSTCPRQQNRFMFLKDEGLFESSPAGTVSTSSIPGMDGSYLNNAFIESRGMVIPPHSKMTLIFENCRHGCISGQASRHQNAQGLLPKTSLYAAQEIPGNGVLALPKIRRGTAFAFIRLELKRCWWFIQAGLYFSLRINCSPIIYSVHRSKDSRPDIPNDAISGLPFHELGTTVTLMN